MKNLGLIAFLLAGMWTTPSLSAATNSVPKIYRMSELESARKRAIAENKPIAWLGTSSKYLVPYKNLLGKSSHAATAYAIRALQNETVLIYSDCETENHTEPAIIDQAMHSPEPHYKVPGVIILTPNFDRVLGKTFREEDAHTRATEFSRLLKIIRDKKSWSGEKKETAPKTSR